MEALKEYRKTEIINGVVYNMTTPNMEHRIIQGNLHRIIGNFLHGKRCKVFFEPEVNFAEEDIFQPDLAVVCDAQKMTPRGIKGAPDFIVEVLSLGTKKRDITVKKKTYERYGVKEYWIIDPKAESVEVYLLHDGVYDLDNVYQHATEEEMNGLSDEEKADIHVSLKLSLYDDLEIQVKDIFEGIDIFNG